MRPVLIGLSVLLTSTVANAANCVNVFYSRYSNDDDISFLQAEGVVNLLAHFPGWGRVFLAADEVHPVDWKACSRTIVYGSTPGFPAAFRKSLRAYSGSVLWVGKGLESMGKDWVSTHFGLEVIGEEDVTPGTPPEVPDFFRNVTYRGETFRKVGVWEDDVLAASGFVQRVRAMNATEVLAQITHSGTNEAIPYVTENKVGNQDYFFIADLAMDYPDQDDRVLVLSDVLFDLLGESPKWGEHPPAVLRIEDVSICTPLPQVQRMVEIANELGIPANIAVYPLYRDLHGEDTECPTDPTRAHSIVESSSFLDMVQSFKDKNVSWIWHGVTHQMDELDNPTGTSGLDSEFWDTVHDQPAPYSSVPSLLGRFDWGLNELTRAKIGPLVWEVPHYIAGPLEYRMFSKLFSWNIGEITYYPYLQKGHETGCAEADYRIDGPGQERTDRRARCFGDFNVELLSHWNLSQFFPYEILGDAYLQRVFPENLGYFETFSGEEIQTKLARAKRNRSLRDNWASFFIHPYLLGPENEPKFRAFLEGLKSLGYQFVNLDQEAKAQSFAPMATLSTSVRLTRTEARKVSGHSLWHHPNVRKGPHK